MERTFRARCGIDRDIIQGRTVTTKMKAEILNAFFVGASNAIAREIKSPVQRTGLHMAPSNVVTDEVVVYIAFVGQVRGAILIGMSIAMARQLAGTMLGEPQAELTEMGMSALAELGNLIAGGAAMELEKLNYPCDITPPSLMVGRRARLSTLGLPRFVIPLTTAGGEMRIHVAVDVAFTR